MRVELDKSFPKSIRRSLEIVANEVLRVVRKRISGVPPQGERNITVTLHEHDPITFWPLPNPPNYTIALNVYGDLWARLAYQLGHELGHILLDPCRTNGVLEILATAVSLQTLSDMQKEWPSVQGPSTQSYADRIRYSKAFGKLRNDNCRGELAKVPNEIRKAVAERDWTRVSSFMYEQRSALETATKAEHSPLHHLGALLLLERGIPWAELVGLGSRTSPDPTQDPKCRKDLKLLPSSIPDWLTPVWKRID